MYDSDSDLTEDDGDYKPSISSRSKKTGAATQKQGGYRIKGVLKVPRPTTYTTQAIYGVSLRVGGMGSSTQSLFFCGDLEQIISSDINLEPEYQRGEFLTRSRRLIVLDVVIDVVWPEAKQIGIIDSIFRNFYIPPVIFGS
jgi:hypothetical protein